MNRKAFVRSLEEAGCELKRRQQRDLMPPDLESALIRMRHVVPRLYSTTTLDELRGWEGTAAAIWRVSRRESAGGTPSGWAEGAGTTR